MYDQFDPYAKLGVAREATLAEIKKAYRQRAKATHPDKKGGGSEELFQDVNRAYRVLSDTAARLHYDNTGTIDDAVDNTEGQAMGLLIGFFARVAQETLDQPVDPLQQDMIDTAVKYLYREMGAFKKRKADAKRTMTVLGKMEKSLKVKRGNGLLKKGLTFQVKALEAAQANYDRAIKVHELALKALEDYSFDPEPVLRQYTIGTNRGWYQGG